MVERADNLADWFVFFYGFWWLKRKLGWWCFFSGLHQKDWKRKIMERFISRKKCVRRETSFLPTPRNPTRKHADPHHKTKPGD